MGKTVLKSGGSLLDIALDNLSLGRAQPFTLLCPRQRTGAGRGGDAANLPLPRGGRLAAGGNTASHSARLARARGIYRITGALDKAKRDLDEAFSIATRGGMGLYLADCHLEYARLALAAERSNVETSKRSNVDEAREHWKTAKEMIAKMGYHRRDKEVEELEEQIE